MSDPLTSTSGIVGAPSSSTRFRLYGLTIESEVRLPGAPVAPDAASAPDVVIRQGRAEHETESWGEAVASIPCPMHGMDMMEHRGPRGIRIWLRSIGVFQIAPDYNLVEVYPDRETDQQALGFGLAGPILLFVRHVRGSPGLHASALVIGEDAIAFLGPQRSGKSTLAAALLRVGATLLTDDALPLAVRDDGICGYPGLPFMKLWRETAHHTLNLGDDLPRLVPGVDKRLLELEGRFPVAPEPATLRALYVLNRYDPVRTGRSDIALEPLTQKEALLALLAHTFGRAYLLPGDDRQALPLFARLLAQSPVSLLSYPSGFDQQAAVSARILDDLVRR